MISLSVKGCSSVAIYCSAGLGSGSSDHSSNRRKKLTPPPKRPSTIVYGRWILCLISLSLSLRVKKIFLSTMMVLLSKLWVSADCR